MNALIGMISDFLENLSDPALGKDVNEAYNMRLGLLLDSDDNLSAQLANTDLSPEDVPSLSLVSWLWYLRWREHHGGRLPDDAFLDGLYDATVEPIVRLRVVDAVVAHSRRAIAEQGLRVPTARGLSGVPEGWLRRRMLSIVGAREERDEEERLTGVTRNEAAAWELAAYLLQLGDDFSLTALGALLAERWSGRSYLVGQVEAVLNRPGLDPDAVRQLRERLRLYSGGDE
jgi:hypothetical protein